ncbi:hypothetical protein HC026_07590 [Lactobacillus sp. LC28-10]|uniref:Uncharacterized protein n=1 Tax=Secundilactobacillus angelensis TaxID=2722706 RepID=A0ABX1L143_9LACO|nr:hypothetical protein [Secundilactobacillus angelensis]MCH5462676.1 hypothetical protein [Secundilactobacillus angelensis]NLR18788.1 hypothetical protein [Secundilactobacillus angelensis]
MLSNVRYYTQVQSDVSQELISLDKQAKYHVRATGSQLVCLILFLAATIGAASVQPLASINYTSVTLKEVIAAPAEQLFFSLLFGAFCISWIFWLRDLKYESLSSKYDTLFQQHSELIKTSATLTELNAHYHHLMSMATRFTITSHVILLGYAAAIVIYHLQP